MQLPQAVHLGAAISGNASAMHSLARRLNYNVGDSAATATFVALTAVCARFYDVEVRTFTVQEANALLPRVSELIRNLQRQREELGDMQRDYADALERTSSNGHSVAEKLTEQRRQLELMVEGLNAGIGEIEELGCTVKDVDTGLVDFPGLRDGRIVNLCWRLGEPEVAYWHSLDTGFASRQPL
ncbi:MAG TPA: DUF2203 domain-containing protein [Chloroflexota bacterium]|nr:DUF2203 domain-containing protein [Chloroflexota bacterium]